MDVRDEALDKIKARCQVLFGVNADELGEDTRFIERGYEDFELKLKGLGAKIERVSTDRELKKARLKLA